MSTVNNGARLLKEMKVLIASLAPERRERVIGVLREVVASLDDEPDPDKYCNRAPDRASF